MLGKLGVTYTNYNFQVFLVNLFNPTTSFKWVCVCVWSPAFFLLLYKIDIMRKQVLTLRLNQLRKIISSFHTRKMGIFVIIGYLPFAHSWGFSIIFINLWRQHLHVGIRRVYPLPQSRFCCTKLSSAGLISKLSSSTVGYTIIACGSSVKGVAYSLRVCSTKAVLFCSSFFFLCKNLSILGMNSPRLLLLRIKRTRTQEVNGNNGKKGEEEKREK